MSKWNKGTINHPKETITKKIKVPVRRNIKDNYIGMTKLMNCGLKATVLDYNGCKNLTVKFEDGVIRSGIRSDHFMDGKVAHP